MNVSNVLRDTFVVILITCSGTHFRKKQTQLSCLRMLIGPHVAFQPRIALSSGEAELYAGLRRISETLRFVHMTHEFHTQDGGRIIHRVDASACRAIMLRRGCGGLKHITVKSLWVQEAVREYLITKERVPRDAMHAHILASPSSADELKRHLAELMVSEIWSLKMQAEIEALRKNLVQKCLENRKGEWLNLESRNLVPRDLVKLE